MAQQDNRPESFGTGDSRAAEQALKAMTQELKNLQQGLIVQLGQDVSQLRAEKARLTEDIAQLRAQYQQLQSQQLDVLSRRQLAQQQVWAKQLAQVLAAHLQEALTQQLNQAAEEVRLSIANGPAGHPSETSNGNGYSENAYRLLASLDSTFSNTFRTLQQELNSYQSSLSEQLNQMHTLEQQGTTILETLVNRLREQLEADVAQFELDDYPAPTAQYPPAIGNGYSQTYPVPPTPEYRPPNTIATKPQPGPEPAPAAPSRPVAKPKPDSQVKLGIILVLLSTLALSIHNVAVGIIGNPSPIFGLFQTGGFIKLNSLGNSLLILWLRMVIVVPLMAVVAGKLYPPVWRDLRRFLLSPDRRPLWTVVGSGAFLFLSQILIYIAIAAIGPGVAVTILFMYPIVTVPLAWFFFSDRPTSLRVGVMLAVTFGVVLTAWPKIAPSLFSGKPLDVGGVGTAALSGVAFALFLIFMQLGFKKLHPVPVTLVQFSTIFVLSSLALILPFPLGVEVLPDNRLGFFAGGLILGILTLLGYLLNNFGVRYMGAGPASIIASSGPAVTALLAVVLVPVSRNFLSIEQIIGILVVTFGVAALAFEKNQAAAKAPKAAK